MNETAAWNYALNLYERPGVATELLRRQDEEGLDIVLHLFTGWLCEEHGMTLSETRLREAQTLVRPWREQVVQPLRAARRAAKVLGPTLPLRDALRQSIQGAELDAERVQMNLLCTWLESIREAPSSP
jgi:uncharacterized protein (TIGR02444 family)